MPAEASGEKEKLGNEEQEENDEGEEEEEEEEAVEPEIDEKQLVYSTMEGVKLLSQPQILKAELHEHQVSGVCTCESVMYSRYLWVIFIHNVFLIPIWF